MDISTLLRAAEYLARRENEDEHCYALTAPVPVATRSHKQKSSKAKITRSSHNELEKNSYCWDLIVDCFICIDPYFNPHFDFNSCHCDIGDKRAHLRHCFEELKRVVPFSGDASRHTTLGLLRQSRLFIEAAQERHRQSVRCLKQLLRERQQLLRHQKILEAGGGSELSFRGSHTISESSISSSSSSGSSAFSEKEDLDVLGSGTSGPSEDEEASDVNEGETGLDYSIAFALRL